MLEDMSLIKMSYIEEATYPAKKKKVFQWSRMSAVAACLCMVIGLGSIAFATGAIDAIKAYFSPQSSVTETLLKEGTLTATDGKIELRVDNYIADQDKFIFTVSLIGTGKTITTSDSLKTAWITNSGEKIESYNKEFGAYTTGTGWGSEGFVAHATSMYEDADATLIVINQVPEGYDINEMKGVVVQCKDVSLDVEIGDSLVETYMLSAKDGVDVVTNFRASAIGFSFESENETCRISIIKTDGTHIEADEKSAEEKYYGFWGSISTEEGMHYSYQGRWAGEGAIGTGILDLDRYAGICVDNIDYFFCR